MKILIWIICAVVGTIVSNCLTELIYIIPKQPSQSIDDYAIMIGTINGLVVGITMMFSIWLAKKLCKKYDWEKACKKAASMNMTLSEYGRYNVPEELLEKLQSFVAYEQIDSTLYKAVKAKRITKEQYIILLKEYTKGM